jgi:tRNA dimethylallyltransferase
MYLRGLLKGLVAAPPRNAATRARLRAMVKRHGADRLHRLLARRDPGSAERIPPQDTQRLVRALELAFVSGGTWSERLAAAGTWSDPDERYRAMKFALDLDRERLARRLAERVEAFFAAGLPGEVAHLLASGVPETANAFKGIGYRQVVRALRSARDPDEERAAIVVATRQLAKRQRTWLRREPGLTRLDAGEGVDALADRIVSAWQVDSGRGASA